MVYKFRKQFTVDVEVEVDFDEELLKEKYMEENNIDEEEQEIDEEDFKYYMESYAEELADKVDTVIYSNGCIEVDAPDDDYAFIEVETYPNYIHDAE